MLTQTIFILTRDEDESHDLLCDAVLYCGGYIVVGGAYLFEVVTWYTANGDGVRRWELHAVEHAGRC